MSTIGPSLNFGHLNIPWALEGCWNLIKEVGGPNRPHDAHDADSSGGCWDLNVREIDHALWH